MDDVLTKLKILIIGNSGVGKSSLLLRFTDDDFDPNQIITVGVDIKMKKLTIDGKTVKMEIWDTAGHEKFRSLSPKFYKDAHGAILVYDVTDKTTYRELDNWLNELDIYLTKPNMIKMIVGNKTDLPMRQVTEEEGMRLAKWHEALFMESSAKTTEGVESAFEELVRKIIQTPDLWEPYLWMAGSTT